MPVSYPYPCLSDETIICELCGSSFLFSVSDQRFFNARGFDKPPKRCPTCRKRLKELRCREDAEREYCDLMERTDVPTKSSASGYVVNRSSGRGIQPFGCPDSYFVLSFDNLDLTPKENYISGRYYGERNAFPRFESDVICPMDSTPSPFPYKVYGTYYFWSKKLNCLQDLVVLDCDHKELSFLYNGRNYTCSVAYAEGKLFEEAMDVEEYRHRLEDEHRKFERS